MRVLFEESKAAAQCRAYAVKSGYTEEATQELLDRAYSLGLQDAWSEKAWVERALNNDRHRGVGIGTMFYWHKTTEGQDYWEDVYNSLVEKN